VTALLDEPFSMLDAAAVAEMASKLRGLPVETTTLILSPSSFANQSLEGDSE
jgi:energy-coupling factor transporter ATP-binding protein EcfA2